MSKRVLRRFLVHAVFNTLVLLPLMGLAWGGIAGFFSDPARALAAILMVAPDFVLTLRTSYGSVGIRHVEEGRAIALLSLMSTLSLLAIILFRRLGFAVLPGGDGLRFTGVLVLGIGTVLRAGPMIQLGSSFSLRLAIQERHQLSTTGFYSRIRHPSYLGSLLMLLGFALVFESGFGLGVVATVTWFLTRRIHQEEALLTQEFGDAYRAYAVRTHRLLPGVY